MLDGMRALHSIGIWELVPLTPDTTSNGLGLYSKDWIKRFSIKSSALIDFL